MGYVKFSWIIGCICVMTAGLPGAAAAGANGEIPIQAGAGVPLDCNSNGVHDFLDIVFGTSRDCNENVTPDECELDGQDCDASGAIDACEVSAGTAPDCNSNGIPDACDASAGTAPDCDFNGVLDQCERPVTFDCNRNGRDDACDIAVGDSNDFNGDAIPDECGAAVCTAVWNGFESDAFVIGEGVNFLDSDTNGDTWLNPSSSCEITAGGCPAGAKAVRNIGTDGIAGPTSFVASEPFAGSVGAFPAPTAAQQIGFDFRLEGSLSARYDHGMYLQNGEGSGLAIAIWFSSSLSDLGENQPGTQDDAAPGNLWVLERSGRYVDTGVTLALDTCHRVEVVYRPAISTVELRYEDAPVYTGPAYDPIDRIDNFALSTVRHTAASPGGPISSLVLDNFELCVTGAAIDCGEYDSIDCDHNGVCDVFEMSASTDADTNGLLDVCEDFCGDCNNNLLRDAAEIAAGSAPDLDGNGVIDDCELSTHANSFEAFSPGPLTGQHGWYELGDSLTSVATAALHGFPTDGNQYVVVADDPNVGSGSSFLFSPRSDTLGDADIERWCWDMYVTSQGFESLFVEITDLCQEVDAPRIFPGGDLDDDALVLAANTGLQFRGAIVTTAQNSVRMLGNPGGGEVYTATSAGSQSSVFGVQPRTACIKIKNNYGIVEARYGPLGLPPASLQIIAAARVETGDAVTHPNGRVTPGGGDRQLMIRTQGDHTATDFWFDNIRYDTWPDCDNDSIRDSAYVTQMPELDANGDGVIDRCQDCNDDCGGFPVADPACLDPVEIAECPAGTAACSDCNANGIPDECDVDPDLPYEGMWDLPAVPCPGSPLCHVARYGGGSCDANDDGIPDECEIAAGSAEDCNDDGCEDAGEIAEGTAPDADANGEPDDCQTDCNFNGIVDSLDIAAGTSDDVDFNGLPDECGASPPNPDLDHDGDVDAVDYHRLQQVPGPVARPTAGAGEQKYRESSDADFNMDGVIDDEDVRLFQQAVTGP